MTGVELIAAERERQIEQERWTPEHDDRYGLDVLANAGAAYALKPALRDQYVLDRTLRYMVWPFDEEWWKPGDGTAEGRVRELAKAGALIAAEIDKIQREAWRP